jgi:hypothetical protein
MKIGAYNIVVLTDAQLDALDEAIAHGWEGYARSQKDVNRMRVAHRAWVALKDAMHDGKGINGHAKNKWGRNG